MNRRGFLRLAAAAPVIAPAVAASAAAMPVAGAVSSVAATFKMDFPTIIAGNWRRLDMGSFRLGWPEPTMAEAVAESADELVDVATQAGNLGNLAEHAINRMADFVVGSFDKVCTAPAPAESVAEQMEADELFEPESTTIAGRAQA